MTLLVERLLAADVEPDSIDSTAIGAPLQAHTRATLSSLSGEYGVPDVPFPGAAVRSLLFQNVRRV